MQCGYISIPRLLSMCSRPLTGLPCAQIHISVCWAMHKSQNYTEEKPWLIADRCWRRRRFFPCFSLRREIFRVLGQEAGNSERMWIGIYLTSKPNVPTSRPQVRNCICFLQISSCNWLPEQLREKNMWHHRKRTHAGEYVAQQDHCYSGKEDALGFSQAPCSQKARNFPTACHPFYPMTIKQKVQGGFKSGVRERPG